MPVGFKINQYSTFINNFLLQNNEFLTDERSVGDDYKEIMKEKNLLEKQLCSDIIVGMGRCRQIQKSKLKSLIEPLEDERYYATVLKDSLLKFVCEIEKKMLSIPISSTSLTKVCYYFCYQLFNF